ncbi:MAG: DUF2798 domain-containing protein [Pseudomonadota bacterium]
MFNVVFALLMSLVMTAIVTLINTGAQPGYLTRFGHARTTAWPIAFTIVLFTAGATDGRVPHP